MKVKEKKYCKNLRLICAIHFKGGEGEVDNLVEYHSNVNCESNLFFKFFYVFMEFHVYMALTYIPLRPAAISVILMKTLLEHFQVLVKIFTF